MAFDLTQDWKYLVGAQTVTLTDLNGNAESVAGALQQSVMIQDNAGASIISETDCNWFLPGANTPTPPSEGFKITDAAGKIWVIQTAGLEPSTQQYMCRAVLER
jgi:hypothetical protein